jgi:hypothetical protein
VLLDASNGKLRDALANETQKHVRERRRKLLRNYKAPAISTPTLLATSGSHHQGALRAFPHVATELGILQLGVEEHLRVITDSSARSLWINRLKGFLFDL